MDVAGEPALLRSLKNAHGANVVHFIQLLLYLAPTRISKLRVAQLEILPSPHKGWGLIKYHSTFTIDKITINNKIL